MATNTITISQLPLITPALSDTAVFPVSQAGVTYSVTALDVKNYVVPNNTITIGTTSISLGTASTSIAGLTAIDATSGATSFFATPISPTLFANATSISIGALTGTTTVNNNLVVTGGITDSNGSIQSTAATANLLTTGSTTVNFATNATAVSIGGGFSTTTINSAAVINSTLTVNNGTLATTNTTGNLFTTGATTVNIASAAATVNIGAAGSTVTTGGNLTVTGNLVVGGTYTQSNVSSINVTDPMIYLASNNTGNAYDIGFVGAYTTTNNFHEGLVKHAADGYWYLFSGMTTEPTTTITITDPTFTLDPLKMGALTASTGDFTGNVNLHTGYTYNINSVPVLSATSLGSSVVASSLTSVGTLTSGTWNATPISPQFGGTGANNGTNTITLAGNLQTVGANLLVFNTTAATNVTLPTSGTLVNSAVTTLSSLSSVGTITTGVWNGTIISPIYGGTGVNNGMYTTTLGGNINTAGSFTTFGAFPLAFTITGSTDVILPTTGTLVNTAVTTLSSLSSVGTITTGTWNAGIISPAYGGTGLSATPTNGQLLIGNGSGYTLAGLTAGTAISVTNSIGSITIDNTGVTRLAAGSGISVSGATGGVTVSNTGVLSFNTRTGAVTLSSTDISGALGYTPASTTGSNATGTWPISITGDAASISGGLANEILYQTATGTTGFITAPTTASTFLGWSGTSFAWNPVVTSATAGTGVFVSGATGAVTFSIGQDVSTSANVQFNSLGVGTPASGTTGEIRATNNVTAYYSDDRLKTKLGKIENALEKLCSLEGFYYEANEIAQALGYKPIKEIGVSAQSTQAVLPEIVAPAPIDENYLTVRYEKFAPLFIEAIKELKTEIDEIKRKIG